MSDNFLWKSHIVLPVAQLIFHAIEKANSASSKAVARAALVQAASLLAPAIFGKSVSEALPQEEVLLKSLHAEAPTAAADGSAPHSPPFHAETFRLHMWVATMRSKSTAKRRILQTLSPKATRGGYHSRH